MSQDGRSQGGGGTGGSGGGSANTNTTTNTSPQGSPITLSVPRPDHQRVTNIYVDTPFQHRVAPRLHHPSHHHHHLHHHGHHNHHSHHHLHHLNISSWSPSSSSSSPTSERTHEDLALVHIPPVRTSGKRSSNTTNTTSNTKIVSSTTNTTTTTTSNSSSSTSNSSTLPSSGVTAVPIKGSTITTSSNSPTSGTTLSSSTTSSSLSTLQQSGSRTPVISKQPAALTFTKSRREDSDGGQSIICSWCGRCRCEACTKPRPPPAAWLCRDKCLCSPAAAVDYASCLCCVKGVLYHCGKDGENGLAAAADHPCSCGGPHAALSWACLAVASIPLPCLFCYWPLTGARHLVESTYQRCTSHGCRCPQGRNPRLQPPPPPPPEKRPLHDCA